MQQDIGTEDLFGSFPGIAQLTLRCARSGSGVRQQCPKPAAQLKAPLTSQLKAMKLEFDAQPNTLGLDESKVKEKIGKQSLSLVEGSSF